MKKTKPTITKELTKKPSVAFRKTPKKTKNRGVRKSKNNQEMELRRVREWELALLGESTKNIAKQFGVTERQVRFDIDKVASEGGREYLKQKMESVMYNHDASCRRRSRKLWEIVIGGKATNDELIRAVKELRHESSEAIKREQSAGILPKEVSSLVNIESSSESGSSENRVQINIIAPSGKSKKEEDPEHAED